MDVVKFVSRRRKTTSKNLIIYANMKKHFHLNADPRLLLQSGTMRRPLQLERKHSMISRLCGVSFIIGQLDYLFLLQESRRQI